MPDSLNRSEIVNASDGYMPQLDTLRTFAIFQVLISHWLIDEKWLKFPFGEAGVILFFVLSGFLITQILLISRNVAEIKNENRFHSAKQFYIRRFLRIFPIYYITLFILFYFNIQTAREDFIWYLTYTSNILYFKTQTWGGNLSHLWTLAVEEQFYIIWPFIILFIPKKYLLPAIIGIILVGPLSRMIIFMQVALTERAYFVNLLTPTCMDCFGLGALLAYFRIKNRSSFEFKTILSKALIIFCFLVMIFLSFYINYLSYLIKINTGIVYQTLFRLVVSAVSFYLIAKASAGFGGFMKKIMENKVLTYLGKISYGMYLYHNFIGLIYSGMSLPVIDNTIIRFAVYTIILIALSSISWYLIEKPVNNLKKYFAYN